MDIFGIGSAIKAAVGMYQIMARQSGRTITMINSLKPGDRIIFTNDKESKRVKRLCKDRDINDIRFEVSSTKNPHSLFDRGSSQGRTILDHSWVEQFYKEAIEAAERDIDYFQKELSGNGEEHIKTKLAAREYRRMMMYIPTD